MTQAHVLERALAAELTEHLGYERGDPAGAGSGNNRNGSTGKRLATELGPIELDVPREVGVTVEGQKEVLGIWVETTEGAKFWLRVMNELKARGVDDVLIVVCDGLTGLPAAVEAVWPAALVQSCVVHLIRASLRYVSYADRKPATALLRRIYTAPTDDAAGRARRARGLRPGPPLP